MGEAGGACVLSAGGALGLHSRHDPVGSLPVADLNTRMEKVKIDNFRPNIVVTGCSAFEEVAAPGTCNV